MAEVFRAQVRPTTLRALNYAPEVERFRAASSRNRSVALGALASEFGVAYRRIFQRVECDPREGVELLGQADMFAAEPVGRWIRADGIRGIEDQRIRPGQVLFAGVGTLGENELYGRCILADERLAGRVIGSDAISLTFKEPGSDLACFAYAFLCTRTGLKAVRAAGYGTKLMSLRLDFLRELPVPIGSESQLAAVGRLVRSMARERGVYARRLRDARHLLEQVPGYMEARAACEHRRAQCVTWDGPVPTFTAWTYASAGEALSSLARRWSGRLGDVLQTDGVFYGPRFARVSCEPPHGVDFLSQRDVFLIRPVGRRIMHPGFPDRKLFVSPRSLLIGGHGTLGEGEIFGRVEFASDSLVSKAFTQDILRLIPKPGVGSLAFAFLSTMLGFRLLRTAAVGTKILSLRADLLRALPFPDVAPDLLARIGRCVEDALNARAQADEAEAYAIRIVEQEVLPAWLA